MSVASDVCVKLDDRVRLMSAVLAATHYPDQAQTRKPHGTHAHARMTRKQLAPFADHEAVRALQNLVDQRAPLEAIFTLALVLHFPNGKVDHPPRWMPAHWDEQLNQFYAASDLAAWWQSEDAVWQKAFSDSQRMFASVNFKAFLQPYLGPIQEELVFIPNISYPTDHELGLRLGNELICIVPPRLAWGDSPPWPYDEDPSYLYRSALAQYGRMLMVAFLRTNAEQIAEISQTPLPVSDQFKALYPTWAEQFATLFVAGSVAIYLEDHVSIAEASAYVLMARKVQGLDMLPGVVSVFRRYLKEVENGRYTTLLDLMPQFGKQLRVANRIVSL